MKVQLPVVCFAALLMLTGVACAGGGADGDDAAPETVEDALSEIVVTEGGKDVARDAARGDGARGDASARTGETNAPIPNRKPLFDAIQYVHQPALRCPRA